MKKVFMVCAVGAVCVSVCVGVVKVVCHTVTVMSSIIHNLIENACRVVPGMVSEILNSDE